MKYAMYHRKTQEILGPAWYIIDYFFHDRGSHLQKSLLRMLKEVLYQITSQDKSIFPIIRHIYLKLAVAQNTYFPR